MTPSELQDEKYLAQWMKRPLRTYLHDKPFYPWVVPEPVVNFDLKYRE